MTAFDRFPNSCCMLHAKTDHELTADEAPPLVCASELLLTETLNLVVFRERRHWQIPGVKLPEVCMLKRDVWQSCIAEWCEQGSLTWLGSGKPVMRTATECSWSECMHNMSVSETPQHLSCHPGLPLSDQGGERLLVRRVLDACVIYGQSRSFCRL